MVTHNEDMEELSGLSADVTVALGKPDKKTGKIKTSLEGYYLGTKSGIKTDHGNTSLHIFQTAEGNVGIWGTTRLDKLISTYSERILGCFCTVDYLGKEKKARPGKSPAHLFKLSASKTNKINVANLQENSSYEEELTDESINDELSEESEPIAARPVAPKSPASTPDAARQARVQALLSGRNRNST